MRPIDTGVSFAGMDTILNAGDVNRDGFGDVLTRDGSGQLWRFAGNGTGALAAGTVISQGWAPVQGLRADQRRDQRRPGRVGPRPAAR